MLQYAQDAQETDTPWQRWEVESLERWETIHTHPMWNLSTRYRRKPRTIRIGEHEVPEPERNAPEEDQGYYVPVTHDINMLQKYRWENEPFDQRCLARGLVHLTEEAAIAHSRALIALTARE
jgi:hypothetical protein